MTMKGGGARVLILDKLSAWFQQKGSQANSFSEMLRSYYGSETTAGEYVSPETAMRCSAVYACVGLLAESIAQLPIKIYRREGRERIEDKTLPIYKLLVIKPSPWQTSFSYRETMMMHLLLRGYHVAIKVRDNGGNVRELLPVHPDAVSIRQLDNWELEFTVTLKTGARLLRSSDVFFIPFRSLDGVRPLSPISYQRETIGLTLAAQRHGARTFQNGAKPGGVLTHPRALKKEAHDRLKEDWEASYGGANIAKTAILEDGMRYEPLSMTNADAQYLETRRFQTEDIARVFGVPLHMIQSTEKSTSWGSGIEQMSIGFVQHTLLPWIRRFEESVARDLVNDPDIEVRLKVEGMLRGDSKSRFAAYKTGTEIGVYSPNEIRELEDMNPREGGDVWLTPLNMRITDENGRTSDGGENGDGT